MTLHRNTVDMLSKHHAQLTGLHSSHNEKPPCGGHPFKSMSSITMNTTKYEDCDGLLYVNGAKTETKIPPGTDIRTFIPKDEKPTSHRSLVSTKPKCEGRGTSRGSLSWEGNNYENCDGILYMNDRRTKVTVPSGRSIYRVIKELDVNNMSYDD